MVGAALLCADGSVYTGCNVENASYTPTCCAERVALFSAICDGKRDFVSMAVVGGGRDGDSGVCYPCGVCRQALSEFVQDDFTFLFADGSEADFGSLLPCRFLLDKDTEGKQ